MKKKLFSLLLIAVLVLSSFSAVFADDNTSAGDTTDPTPAATTYSISTTKAGHTYDIYQILTGDVVTKEGVKVIENIKYGANSAKGEAGKMASQEDVEALKAIGDMFPNDTAYPTDGHKDNENLAALLDYVTLSNPVATATKDAPATGLAPGYYLIKDRDNTLEHPETYTLYILHILSDDLTITPKDGEVTSEKHVDDVNDSTGEETLLKDSADYDIGDSVPYTLTATLPENYELFEKYYIAFTDDMSPGLTWDGKATIFYGNDDTTGKEIEFTATDADSEYDGTVYKFEIADLKTEASDLEAGDVITIKYSAVLNGSAKLGVEGNPNKYRVTYNNNPNNCGEGKPTGDTPWDKNIVFTYKAVFNKIDGDKNPLTGADFTLYKKVDGEWVDVTKLNNGDVNPEKTGDKTGTTFEFKGLDDGEYKLEEIETPTGYNPIDPIEFTITAEHELESDDPRLTSLTGAGDAIEFEVSTDNSTLSSDIVNRSGSTLPETGGMGTTIIYILGAALVIGAGVMLVSRKKMSE